MDSLFGQSCDGQIPLFRSFELHRIAAGKILLRKNLTQIVQHFMAAFLCVVPGSNTDHSKGIVGRCGEVLCFPFLQRDRQPAGSIFPELFHHIRTDFLHQSKEVIGVQILKVQTIHFIAHRHIAGETQQRLRDLLCTDTWFQGILPIPGVVIFTACHDKILLLQLPFQQIKQIVVNFTPSAQAAQVFAEGNSLFRIHGFGPLRFGPCPKQFPHLKGRAFTADHYRRPEGIGAGNPTVNSILDALVKERLQLLLYLGLHPVTASVRTVAFG